MRHIVIIFFCASFLLLPEHTSAYVLPHPRIQKEQSDPHIETVLTPQGIPVRSSRGTFFYRYLPNVPDNRLQKPSRRNISQLQKARTDRIRRAQSKTYRRERAAQRIQKTSSSSATVRGQPVSIRKAPRQ